MRQFIRMIALAALIASGLFWLTRGAHTGWTRNLVTVTRLDPTTRIETTVDLPKFVPGIDFLGGSLVVVVLLFSASNLFRPSRRRHARETAAIREPEAPAPEESPPEPDPEEVPPASD